MKKKLIKKYQNGKVITTSGNQPSFQVDPQQFTFFRALQNYYRAKTDPVLSAKIMNYANVNFPDIIKVFADADNLDYNRDKYWEDYINARPNQKQSGTPQRTYLLNREVQNQEFLKDGWIRKPSNKKEYGLVQKAVGNRNLPVWQTTKDSITRDKLTPIGNTDSWWFGPSEAELPQPGHYPTAVYVDNFGNFYQKGWDLNDYGGNGGDTSGIVGKIADLIGSPVVATTGYQPIKDDLLYYFDWIEPCLDKVPNYNQIMYDKVNILPEITIMYNNKKQTKDYDKSINLRK